MVSQEFYEALALLEAEKGIAQQDFIDALVNALEIAYKKYSGDASMIRIKMDAEKHSLRFYSVRNVVAEVEDFDKEIALEDAILIKKSIKVGDELVQEFTPKDFGRIIVQTVRQVMLQKIREIERNNTVSEFEDKEGELMVATIRRKEGDNIFVEIGGSQIEGVLLPKDQVAGEKYELNSKIEVFVKKVKNVGKNAQVLVSRTSNGLVRRLFENEVPEIKQGIVVIKGIEREPGQRTKIAIYSEDASVDAIGACIGNKGARVNAIVSALNGEKIDIIAWSENPLEYIARALSPAKVLQVKQLDDKSARVIVPDDKLSLAIGKSGQNARLAVKLTGWKIDIKSESVARQEGFLEDEEIVSEEE
jgi:N utilization substance protein A